MRLHDILIASLLSAACVACGDADGAFSVTGSVVGPNVPAKADAVVLWLAELSTTNYAYKFGEGTASGDEFEVTMASDPPPEASKNGGVGIGIVTVVSAGSNIPDGNLREHPLSDSVRFYGFSTRHAVIWKPAGADTSEFAWAASFPDGYSCGLCLDGTVVPVACGEVPVETSTDPNSLRGCNLF